ncbi:hypothetical protein P389DRAFT_194705 [Cystobasidium minutum MCA 4210]|uniref:uncharacterized protein n=1 Tax=Cystobasidium minutum MCA 4210 TaxID=1397322 RepID=UPI0034CE0535|eukprot:jgi/Rhomi1/194705/gm1.2919_g
MLLKTSALAALSIFLQSHSATAFFRLGTGVLVTERADPVVSPGKASAHVHSIAGGNAFGLSLTYQDALKSTCTSSGVNEDKSNYWTPIVYFWHKNGSFIAPGIENQGLSVYYGYNVNEGAVPFPEGFRMIAGQPLARSWNPPPNARQYTEFECLGDGVATPNTKEFPKQICSFAVRMNVYFPRHVVYQVDGKCPPSHPHLYPELHYELWYSNKEDPSKGIIWADGMNPKQPFVLSNGDPTGYGTHGDFFNGWETETLRKALKECTGAMGSNLGDGRAETCPHFTIVDAGSCKKQGNSPDLGNNEKVSGWLPQLPGCVPVTYTDEEAKTKKPGCNNVAPSSSSSSTKLSTSSTSSKQSSTLITSTTVKTSSTSAIKQSTTTSKASTSTSTKPVTTSACASKTVTITKTVTVTQSAIVKRLNPKHRAAAH